MRYFDTFEFSIILYKVYNQLMWFNKNISTTTVCRVEVWCEYIINSAHVYLTLLIDPNDSRRAVVSGRDKYGFTTDAIHVYTHAWLQIIHVKITILSDEVDHSVLRTDLWERAQSWCEDTRFPCWNKLRSKLSPAWPQENLSVLQEERTRPLLS